MVKRSLSQTMFLVLGLVLIFTVCRMQITESPKERLTKIIEQKRSHYTVDIRADELNEFLKLLAEYKKLGMDKDFYVPYLSVLPDQAENWPRKMWFLYHHWDANRFFYVQQRLIYLLQALDIKRDAQAIINLLQEEINQPISADKDKCYATDEEKNTLILQMIEFQSQRIQGADMYFSELILISAKEDQLKELLR